MTTKQRAFLSRLMGNAWTLARQGAQRFGGEAHLYFAIALQLVWQDSKAKPATVWHKGIGNHYLLPGLEQAPVAVERKRIGTQFLLPGLGKV